MNEKPYSFLCWMNKLKFFIKLENYISYSRIATNGRPHELSVILCFKNDTLPLYLVQKIIYVVARRASGKSNTSRI